MSTQTPKDEVLEYFKAMVDVDRLRIAGMLGLTKLTKEQIVDRLNLPLRDVVNHLGFLEHQGIIRKDGEAYELDQAAIRALAKRNLAGKRTPAQEEALPADEYDRKVVRDFTTADGKIKSLPMQPKKFTAIIRYVSQVFEQGKQYPEKEVNTLLLRYHEDFAALRRGLVDEGIMQRQAGVYWMVEK